MIKGLQKLFQHIGQASLTFGSVPNRMPATWGSLGSAWNAYLGCAGEVKSIAEVNHLKHAWAVNYGH